MLTLPHLLSNPFPTEPTYDSVTLKIYSRQNFFNNQKKYS